MGCTPAVHFWRREDALALCADLGIIRDAVECRVLCRKASFDGAPSCL
jgi:hypothetical protein